VKLLITGGGRGLLDRAREVAQGLALSRRASAPVAGACSNDRPRPREAGAATGLTARLVGRLRQMVLARFGVWEKLGLHVLPVHYFSPIPATEDLPDSLFDRQSACVGVDWNETTQERYLTDVFPRYVGETTFPKNTGLSPADAAVLHAMIRHHRPARFVEIGSGESTKVAARACLMNAREGAPCETIAVDPEPMAEVREGIPGLTRLLTQPVQRLHLDLFLDADIVFIDSSHTVRIGGDVVHEVLEILPRLKPGALVHFHDILLPGEYWREWVLGKRYFWAEQYLLQAFLAFNPVFEVLWAARYMHLRRPDDIVRAFPFFDRHRHRITSFWLRRRPAGLEGREAR
jgi:predicted O-methyltransferase YrrM